MNKEQIFSSSYKIFILYSNIQLRSKNKSFRNCTIGYTKVVSLLDETTLRDIIYCQQVFFFVERGLIYLTKPYRLQFECENAQNKKISKKGKWPNTFHSKKNKVKAQVPLWIYTLWVCKCILKQLYQFSFTTFCYTSKFLNWENTGR